MYAQVHFERDDLTLMLLEEDLSKTVRRLLTTKEARQVLEELKQCDGAYDKSWKSRAETDRKALEQGDPLECGKVFKRLSRLAAKSDLRQQDRQHLAQSLELLSEELAHSLGKTPSQARELISEAGAA